MVPLTFSVDNAVEIIPDSRRRELAAIGRMHAEQGTALPQPKMRNTYWDNVVAQHEFIVMADAYEKRKQRLARMKGGA